MPALRPRVQQSEITDVCDKMQLLAQGVVAERNSAKADQKILKLQIHEKEWNQMFSLSQQLLQHQCTIEVKNTDIHLEEAKAQTHASEIELLSLKLQLGEQQLQLQQKLCEAVLSFPSIAEFSSSPVS
jgi:hypothetical protein